MAGTTPEERVEKVKVALNAGLIAQRMYQKLRTVYEFVIHKGVVNDRAVCRLKVKLIRMDDQSSGVPDNLNTFKECLKEFGKWHIPVGLPSLVRSEKNFLHEHSMNRQRFTL